jgi:hypothetical protein
MQPNTDKHPTRRRGTAHAGLAILLVAALAMTLPTVAAVDLIEEPEPAIVLTGAEGLELDENNGRDTFQVHLNGTPTSRVTLTLTAEPGLRVSPSRLQFTPGSAGVDRTVTVRAVNDVVAQGDRSLGIALVAASLDDSFAGLNDTIEVDVVDDEVVGIVLTHSGRDTVVQEGRGQDTVMVRLPARPSGTVVVDVDAGGEGCDLEANPSSLTFTPTNWNRARRVTVTACDDSLIEGSEPHTLMVAVAATGTTAPEYVSETPLSATLPVLVHDNEAGLLVSDVLVNDTLVGFNLSLASRPSTPVTVAPVQADCDVENCTVPAGLTGLDFDPAALVFRPATWNVAQTLLLEEMPAEWGLIFAGATRDRSFAALDTIPVTEGVDNRAWLPFLYAGGVFGDAGESAGFFVEGEEPVPEE